MSCHRVSTTRRRTLSVGVSSPACDRELGRQQGDLLDLLELRQVAVERVHDLTIQPDDVGPADQRRAIARRQPQRLQPLGQHVERRHDQRGREAAPVADHHRLGDQRVLLEARLDRLRRHLLAAGRDEQILLAIGDRAGSRPRSSSPMSPVWNQPSRSTAVGVRRPVPVAAHHVRAAREDLAVLGDAQLDAGDRRARPSRAASAPGGLAVSTGAVSVRP